MEIKRKLFNGQKIKEEKVFDATGDYAYTALAAAKVWLKVNGYSYGSTCREEPIAIQKGKYDLPQKWKNFDKIDKAICDGVITSYNWREGPVKVILFEDKTVL